nr:alanine racemase C-terminal domain-containing protein [Planctomonas sp. JC2975]
MSGQVVTVKRIAEGEGVSYGYIYRAPSDGTIALVTCGYADGIPRSIGNHATVALNGGRARVIGRVAMDVVVIDLGDLPAKAGDEAVFLGDQGADEPVVADWSAITGLDPVELAAGIGPRVARSYTR